MASVNSSATAALALASVHSFSARLKNSSHPFLLTKVGPSLNLSNTARNMHNAACVEYEEIVMVEIYGLTKRGVDCLKHGDGWREGTFRDSQSTRILWIRFKGAMLGLASYQIFVSNWKHE